MTVVFKKSKAKGSVSAPPSKSMAHRYLICGAFSKKSEICGVSFSNDIKATLSCLEALGADIKINKNSVSIGRLDINYTPKKTLFCNESGSTLRFLIPICLLFDKEITLSGTKRLFSRSLSVYEQICKEQGIHFDLKEDSLTVCGKLKSGKYSVRGDISSQFISGLIFALSMLEEDSEIEITGKVESGSYLDLTVAALNDFGVNVKRKSERIIFVGGKNTYKSTEIKVEGDYSNAAFLDAFNLFGGDVSVVNLKETSVQGDRVYKNLFRLLSNGCPTIDISDCPDLAPILMAVAAAKNGVVLEGTKRLKIKESDRGVAMQEELSKLGCLVLIQDNRITVAKCKLKIPNEPIHSHNDHRIVMAMSVLLSLTGGVIEGAEAVTKSYPDFFQDLKALDIEANIE